MQPQNLVPFVGNPRDPMPTGLPFRLLDYLGLLDWTGRIPRDDKRGQIPPETPPLLERLQFEPVAWLQFTQGFETRLRQSIGRPEAVEAACARAGGKWAWDTGRCRELFAP